MKKYFWLLACASLLVKCSDSGLEITLNNNDILESSSTETSVGTLAVKNPTDNATYTFEVVSGATNAFDIKGNQLIVANGSQLDFEDAKTQQITVKATSSDGSTGEQKFTINILNISDEVTNLNDSGAGSLRKLIADATAGSKIGFKSSLRGTIALATPLQVDKKVTIVGPDASTISISGEDLGTVIIIGAAGNLTISGVSIENGNGAGIDNSGKLNISHSIIKNNTGGFGGGITSYGTATIRNCKITNNEAFNGGGVGNGTDMFIYDSSIYGNRTTGNSGAGIVNVANLVVVNTTISGNAVSGNNRVGGAIACVGDMSTAKTDLYNVTIAYNTADVTGGQGGGIYAQDCNLKIKNSIIAKNTATADGPDIFLSPGSIITSLGNNLIGSNADNSFTNNDHQDQVGTAASPLNPKLKALSFNGGFTKTHAFSSDSPAIDQIPAASCKDENGDALTTDQRGLQRPFNTKCDIGAFEQQ